MRRRDKAEVQAQALGVAVAKLRDECLLDDGEGRELGWAQEAQERIACFVELEAMKLRMKSKTARKP